MSIASSAASCRSVSYGGEALPLDQALNKVVKAVQGHLNSLELALTKLAQVEETMDDFEDDDGSLFQEGAVLTFETEDFVRLIARCTAELPLIAASIRGNPPRCKKEWFAKRRAERKDQLAREREELKAEREAAKAALAAEKLARRGESKDST